MAIDESFVDKCFDGQLQKVEEAITDQPLTPEDLEEGLEAATLQGHPDVVLTLLDARAQLSKGVLDSLPGEGLNQNPMFIRHFLDYGLDPNVVLSSGLPLLCFTINPEYARELLSHGTDPNFTGPSGKRPMMSALAGSHAPNTTLFELLIEYGAKLDSDLLFHVLTPRTSQAELKVNFLLNKGLDPNTTSETWGTVGWQRPSVRNG